MGIKSLQNGQRRSGAAIVYIALILPVLVGFASLAVDYAHVQVVRLELRRAAVAAARYGAIGLGDSPATALANAVDAAKDNSSDGAAITVDSNNDLELGTWDSTTRTFTVWDGSSQNAPNAIRVTVKRTAARNSGVSLLFAQFFGQKTMDVQTRCVALYHPAQTTIVTVKGTNDPYLAGSADGTNASTDDWAGSNAPNHVDCRPDQVTGVKLVTGATLSFKMTGQVANNPAFTQFGPDGNLGWILSHDAGSQNGVANVTAPINAVMGMFLDDSQPDTTNAPPALDFSSAASRDYSSISPLNKQPFFIGDGTNSSGAAQKIVVPPGATRLYICTMDGFEWSNNVGTFQTQIKSSPSVSIVQ